MHRTVCSIAVVPALLLGIAVAHAQSSPGPAPSPPAVPANLPPPPADPHDLEGVWQPRNDGPHGPPPSGGLPPPTTAASITGSTLVCTPVQRLGGAGGGMSNLWIMGRTEIVMISEEDQDVRKIYLTGKHRTHNPPDPNGDSTGHWEGNTLVVDTVGFAPPHAGEHVVEHIRKQGNALLDAASITTKDGNTTHRNFDAVWRPDYQVWENICEEGYANFKIINGRLDNTGSN